jgi:serine protease Do
VHTVRTGRAAAALIASAVLLTAPFAAPATAETLAPETMLAERTNPAMHLVTTDYTATVAMKTTDWSADGNRLRKRVLDELAATGGSYSYDDVLQVTFAAAASDPERYFKGIGPERTKELTRGGSGSGFVVNGDGYLITARHVVTDDGKVKADFKRDGAAAFTKDELKGWKKFYAENDIQLSDATVDAIRGAMAAYTSTKVKVKMSAPKVSVILGVASADGSRTGKIKPAEVVYRSNPALEADIALLRIRGQAAMPTVSLASKSLPQGAQVYINCFPALPDRSEAALLTPTMTDGRITSLKPNAGDIEMMQTDAQASEGCSGGAAMDKSGNVVGVLVSGAVNGEGQSLGQFYLMPVDIVREALQARNIPADVSLTTIRYDQALADYSQSWCTLALEKFQEVKSLYPPHPYVSRYISDCQTMISRGESKVPPPPVKDGPSLGQLPGWVPILAAAIASAAVMGAVLLLLKVRSGRRAATPPALSEQPAGSPPPPSPAGAELWMSEPDRAAEGSAPPGASRITPAPSVPPDLAQSTPQPEPQLEAKHQTEDGGTPGVEPDSDGPDTFPADDWAPIGFVASVPPTAAGVDSKPE